MCLAWKHAGDHNGMPTRNRIEMSQALFDRLISVANTEGEPIDAPDQARWIQRRDDLDAALMAKAEVQPLALGRNSRVLMVSFKESRYYLFAGFNSVDEPVGGFEPCDLTPGLLALAILELELSPVASGAAIRDVLEGRYLGVEGYEGHEVTEIATLFPNIICFKADNNYPFTSDIYRSVGSYLARTYAHGALALTPETLTILTQIFEVGNRHVPFDLLLQGMLSFSWTSFYLEVYRCFENVYAFTRLNRVTDIRPVGKSLRDLAIMLEKELTWRPREEEALASILRFCSQSKLEALYVAICGAGEPTEYHSAAAKHVYSTRNELVHFRPRMAAVKKNDAEWDLQIQALLECLDEIYAKIGDQFHELPT